MVLFPVILKRKKQELLHEMNSEEFRERDENRNTTKKRETTEEAEDFILSRLASLTRSLYPRFACIPTPPIP